MVPWSASCYLFCTTSKQPDILNVSMLIRFFILRGRFLKLTWVVASSTIIVYDHSMFSVINEKFADSFWLTTVTTFDQEVSIVTVCITSLELIDMSYQVELIWKAPWTFGKLLFLMVRIDSMRRFEIYHTFFSSRIAIIHCSLSCKLFVRSGMQQLLISLLF